jgi:ankyrin repeat protein
MDISAELGPLTGGTPEPDFIQAYHRDLRRYIANVLNADQETRAAQMHALGKEWLEACARGNPASIQIFVDSGMDLTYQDAETRQSALHSAAGTGARSTIRLLLNSGRCNYLLRDAKGRLASECAYLFGEDVALARLLGNKERKQAVAEGIALTRRP